ncbi:bleomycin resistance protein [Streptomyces marianii]|uniref:VOC family protein n=1 Tax=Streptomyces marianii TaxID=1817406 RepID=A0A5R9E616_9ACTN|nr:VOC family protein [Streptomyces marianii]TLQ45438.1 VOC family protein [Streptomyces marianii]
MSEKTIPILPCRTIQPVLDFYTTLGFEVSCQQKSPNPYAAVQRGGIQLHFFGMKQYEPAESFSTCIVQTDDVDGLHEIFRSRLKAAYGRVPNRGLPRIGPLKNTSHGVRQFLMTDPGGNCIRIGQQTSGDQRHRPAPKETFARALHHASLLADSRDDPAGAAKIIDRALRRQGERPTPVQLLRLLVLRADLADRLGENDAATSALVAATAVHLTAEEQEFVRDDLERLTQLLG